MALFKTLLPSLTPDELTSLTEVEVIDILPLPDRVSTLLPTFPRSISQVNSPHVDRLPYHGRTLPSSMKMEGPRPNGYQVTVRG